MNDARTGAPVDQARIWELLTDLRGRRGQLPASELAVALDPDNPPCLVPNDDSRANLRLQSDGGWTSDLCLTPEAAMFLDLYLPVALAGPERPIAIAHLGQSLDGRIATESGASYYVTGPDNIDHLHRLRALCDAVVVGAATAVADNPRLTTRRVDGENPVRVVIDPDCRVSRDNGLFHDGEAETLLVCRKSCPNMGEMGDGGLIALDDGDDGIGAKQIVEALHDRGLDVLFVEGGGVTVSRFLQQGALDRLHVTVAPLILGSGRQGLTLPVIEDLSEALRPRCKTYPMGADVLFDCEIKPRS